MRSLNLDAVPSELGSIQSEARRVVTELLKFHISINAYSSSIKPVRSQTDLQLSFNREKRGVQEKFQLYPSPKATFNAVIAVIVRAVGLLPDSTLVDLYSSHREFRFFVHTEAYAAEISCLASMPKSLIPSANFIVENIHEKLILPK